jgi:hypothetical protein
MKSPIKRPSLELVLTPEQTAKTLHYADRFGVTAERFIDLAFGLAYFLVEIAEQGGCLAAVDRDGDQTELAFDNFRAPDPAESKPGETRP